MVDMSPIAVAERLRLMGELCEVSSKLAYAKWVEEQSDAPESDAQSVETAQDDSQNRER